MAITRDTYVKGGGNGVNSYAFPTLTTAGGQEVILVLSDTSADAATISSVTATGLTFTVVKSQNKAAVQGNVEVWKAFAVAPFSGAITVNFNGGVFPQATGIAVAYKLVNSTGNGAMAVGVSSSAGSASAASIQASVTTTMNNSLIIAAVGSDSNNTISAGIGQTKIDTSLVGGASVSEMALIEKNTILTSPAFFTMSATLTAAPVGMISVELIAPIATPLINKLRPAIFKPGLAR